MKDREWEGLIQVAGIRDAAEAGMLVRSGVRQLAFPLGPGIRDIDLPEDEAVRIIATLGPAVRTILITYRADAGAIAADCERLGVAGVQLHGPIAVEEIAVLKRLHPGLLVIRSLIVGRQEPDAVEREMAACTPFVDAFLTDTFDPESGRSGATGRTHNWEISRHLAEISSRPLILAGGLHPGNVREAIRRVRPGGVDAHTGLEGPDGRKDAALVAAFVAEARAGFAEAAR
ncbi:MAG TPA: phosphoribosylanthranilate isomerase [Syntrophales bacterium]|nr:phosphoribosylanthranilate isomerase [Syntrophales bacterium]